MLRVLKLAPFGAFPQSLSFEIMPNPLDFDQILHRLSDRG